MQSKLSEKLLGVGIKLKPADMVVKPTLGVFGIQNTKEVIILLAGIVNTAVQEQGITAYASVLPDVYPAVKDFKDIGNEFTDMSDEEFIELLDCAKDSLDFDGDAAKYEEAVEDIVIGALYVLSGAIKFGKARNQE